MTVMPRKKMSELEQEFARTLKTLNRRIQLSFVFSVFLFAIFLTEFFGAAKLLEWNQSRVEKAKSEYKKEVTQNDYQNGYPSYDLTSMMQPTLHSARTVSELEEEIQQPIEALQEASIRIRSTNITRIPIIQNEKFKPLSPPPPRRYRVTVDKAIAYLKKKVPFKPPPLSQQAIMKPNVFRKAQQCLLNSSYAPKGKVPLLHNPKYTLPKDAEAHYIELLNLTAPLRSVTVSSYAGYNGPWLENAFISEFCCDKPLSYFGGLIPLFIQWTDVWHLHREYWHNHTLGLEFFSRLRKDVIYLVVSQHADGIFHKMRFLDPRDHWNLLILSGGGHGHAPIPLFLQEQQYEEFDKSFPQYLFVFAGTLNAKLFPVRKVMVDILDELSVGDPPIRVRFYSGKLWQKVMRSGLLNLAPRGYGRTSFRIVEAVQMGLIPIYIYDDHDWSPYKGTPAHVSNFGYVVPISKFKSFAEQMAAEYIKDPAGFLGMLEQKRSKILQFRDSHYTMQGLMNQITYLVQDDPRSNIACQRNPQKVLNT